MKRGPGRPATDKVFAEAYAVWIFVREREAEGVNRKTAEWLAGEAFGMKRATVYKRLWLVNEVAVILAHLQRNAPELYEKKLADLYRAGWFGDD